MRRVWLLGAIAFSVACGAAGGDDDISSDAPGVVMPGLETRIVGGSPSSTAQDAVVYLNLGQGACTGTMVAPTLVLTARHCVAQINQVGTCGTFGTQAAASTIGVAVGVNAGSAAIAARGKRIFVDSGASSVCSNDIALVEVDRAVPAPTAKIRLTRPTVGEVTVAVGYGDSGNGQVTPGRYQRGGLPVVAVGPTQASYATRQGQSMSYEVSAIELATGESTCYGDSGGPLFDAQGQVIGITSRGIDQSCIDRPSIFSGTAGHDALIKSAFAAVGASLDPVDPPDAGRADSGGGGTSSGSSGSGTSSGESGDSPAPDEGQAPAPSKGARRPLPRNQAAASGCAAGAPARSGAAPGWLAGVAVAAIALGRRRKDRSGRERIA